MSKSIYQAAKKATKLLIEHMETLTPQQATSIRASLRALAIKGKAKSFLSVIAVAVLALGLAGCPSNYHTLVTIEHDFDSSVKALQSGSTAEFQAGNIDAPTNQAIEGVVLKLAQAGQQINTLLQQNASKQTIATQTANISADLQELLSSGLAGVKNSTTKQELTVLIQATQAIIANFTTELGSAK